MASSTWGTDAPVSIPEPPENDVVITFGGFGFTSGGMAHDITSADIEVVFSPTYGPGE